MSNLIDFLKKYFHNILFVILLLFSLILIFNNYHYSRFKIKTVENSIVNPIYRSWNNLLYYFDLRKENEHLKAQNLLLLKQLSSNFVLKSDSIYSKSVPNLQGKSVRIFDYVTANVIYNSINKTHNYIIIDKGYEDSIKVDMAVFSPEGVLGIVNDVSAHFATVMSVLHPNTLINAKLMPAAQVGTVSWDGGDPDYVYLSFIPQHTIVRIGDTVVTSGYSNIFPKDILIGFVEDIDKNSNDSFNKIKIKLSVDFSNLNAVFVVKSIYKEEIDQLKTNFNNE